MLSIEKGEMMSKRKQILFIAMVTVTIGLCFSCRSPEDADGNPDDADGALDLPDAGPDGGCPAGFSAAFDDSQSPYMGGEESADVVIDTVKDFYCPACASFSLMADELWQNPEYQKRARLYFHNLVVHPDALEIHQAARAVANQDNAQFWKLHDAIYERTNAGDSMTIEDVVEWVQNNLQIDMNRFNADRASAETLNFINAERARALELGVTGTPTVFVCGVKLASWRELETVVNGYLGIAE